MTSLITRKINVSLALAQQISLFIILFITLTIGVQANQTQPKFTIVPQGSSTAIIGNSGVGHIMYTVTNRLPRQEIITMTPVPGITQLTTNANDCQSPMVINPGQSCTLVLQIDGTQFLENVPHTLDKTPQICIGTSQLSCSQPSAVNFLKIRTIHPAVTIGGTQTGLTMPGLVLKNLITGETFSVPRNQTGIVQYFAINYGGEYHIIIQNQPVGARCTLSNNYRGVNVRNNVIDLNISCSPIPVTIGGSVSGLTTDLVLINNGDPNDRYILTPTPTFQTYFTINYGGHYNITIPNQPPGLICTPTNNSHGENVTANVTTLDISCSPVPITVGGTVSGIPSTGVVLINHLNPIERYTVSPTPAFQNYFTINYGGHYDISVESQPSCHTCSLVNAQRENVIMNVIDANLTCIENPALTVTTRIFPPTRGTITPSGPVRCGGTVVITGHCKIGSPQLISSTTCPGSYRSPDFYTFPITSNCEVNMGCRSS